MKVLISKLNSCNIYIFLWMMYYLQGVLYPSGGVVSQGFLLIILLMGVYYSLKLRELDKLPPYFHGLAMLFIVLLLYGIELLLSGRQLFITQGNNGGLVPNYFYLKGILMSFPNVCCFYYFSRKGLLSEDVLRIWAMLFLFVAIAVFYRYKLESLSLLYNGDRSEEITNNGGYLFLALLPVSVLFNNKPWLQYSYFFICIAFIIWGMKRGAIIIGVIVFLYFIFHNYKTSTHRVRNFFLTFLILGGFAILIHHMVEDSAYFMARYYDTLNGDSSERDIIYSFFWDYYKNQNNILGYLFGHGANATLSIGINYAHNDWLELLINQGLIGALLYFAYWLYFYKTIRLSNDYIAKMALGMCFIIMIMKTLFSMSYSDMNVFISSVMGLYMARGYNQ